MSLAPLQKCSPRLRGFSALLGTQAKCERHLGDARIRIGGVEKVEKWPFPTVTCALTSFLLCLRSNKIDALAMLSPFLCSPYMGEWKPRARGRLMSFLLPHDTCQKLRFWGLVTKNGKVQGPPPVVEFFWVFCIFFPLVGTSDQKIASIGLHSFSKSSFLGGEIWSK